MAGGIAGGNLLCLLLVLLLAFFMMMLAIVPVLIAGWITGADLITTMDITNLGPIGFIYLNLSLIVLIPASGLSIWIVHGIRPKFLSSVAGGIRWRWLLRCVAVILPFVGDLHPGWLRSSPHSPPPPRSVGGAADHRAAHDTVAGSGRGVLFRGWIMQNVGAWFSRPIVGLVVSLVVSAVTFSTLHLSRDPWMLGTIACLAVASGLAAWRTGG